MDARSTHGFAGRGRALAGLAALFVLGFGAPSPANAQDSGLPLALRVDGYIGLSVLDFSGDNLEGFYGGGTGSLVWLDRPVIAQLDLFGDRTDYDPGKGRNVGGAISLGYRDQSRGTATISMALQEIRINPVDRNYFRIGAHGELFLNALTLAGRVGFVDIEKTGDDGFYARADLSFYVHPNLVIQGGIGVLDFEDRDELILGSIEAEMGVTGLPVSAFGRWESSFSRDVDFHTFALGLRLYWDANMTIKQIDREVMVEPCIGAPITARFC